VLTNNAAKPSRDIALTQPRALVVDDEPDIRELLEITLGRMGVETCAAGTLAEARAQLRERQFDLCLTDINLPDGNGLTLVEEVGTLHPDLPIAVITAYGSIDLAINALKAGAFDFVSKPVDLKALRGLVSSALQLGARAPALASGARPQLIGDSAAMRAIREQITRLARSQAPVYISGESGAGKEVAARAIHAQSVRADGPFVPVNCGALPPELMDSEFFGHLKGAFTGAIADKVGLFQAADGGTLLLDEVADLPLAMQVKLLRAIQEKAVRPVGSTAEVAVDVRVLCATHRDLAQEVRAGRFRQDLFYRLNVIELPLPSLRARREDIPVLAADILRRLAARYDIAVPTLTNAALAALTAYGFPGNVRELENILERAVALSEGQPITPIHLQIDAAARSERAPSPGTKTRATTAGLPDGGLPDAGSPDAPAADAAASMASDLPALAAGQSLEDYLEAIERRLINDALAATRWNRTAAAERLGLTFRALRYRLKKLGLD
jgi:two-component system response regulator PilR (NtrC family)